MSQLPRGSPDDQEIQLNDSDEIRYWSTVFRVTPAELASAVGKIGADAKIVRAYFGDSNLNPDR